MLYFEIIHNIRKVTILWTNILNINSKTESIICKTIRYIRNIFQGHILLVLLFVQSSIPLSFLVDQIEECATRKDYKLDYIHNCCRRFGNININQTYHEKNSWYYYKVSQDVTVILRVILIIHILIIHIFIEEKEYKGLTLWNRYLNVESCRLQRTFCIAKREIKWCRR